LERRQCGSERLKFFKIGLEFLEGLRLIGLGHEPRTNKFSDRPAVPPFGAAG
jgi:hypothetical protein